MLAAFVEVEGVRLSRAAAEVAEWAGVNPGDDLARLRAGLTREALLAECLSGAEGHKVESAWAEYVSDLAAVYDAGESDDGPDE